MILKLDSAGFRKRKNQSLKFGIHILFSVHCIALMSQSIVKKDSSERIPFLSKVYYNSNIDTLYSVSPKIATNHRLNASIEDDNIILSQGNMGSGKVPVLYNSSFYREIKLGRVLGDYYFYKEDNIPYFTINKPLSELDFIFFGNGNEEFRGLFSQNLNRTINMGIGIRRLNNKGYFLNQANEHNNLYFTLVHIAPKLRSNLEFVFNESNQRESGGYSPDIYRDSTSPSQWASASPILSEAIMKFKNYKITLRNRFYVKPSDSIVKDTFIFRPKSSAFYIDHTLDFSSERQYYQDTILSSSRSEYYWLASDTSIHAIRSKYLQTKIRSDLKLNFRNGNTHFSIYNLISYDQIYGGQKFDTNYLLDNFLHSALGGELTHFATRNWKINAKGYKALSGYSKQDFKIEGSIQKHFSQWNMNIWSAIYQQYPDYVQHRSISTGIDTFFNFQTQKTWESGIILSHLNQGIYLKLQYFQIDDYLTRDRFWNPIQVQNHFFQIYAHKEWQWKSIYFPTRIAYQNSIFPRGYIQQMFAFKNKLFSKNNNVLLGVELSLNYGFDEVRYSPFYMQNILDSTHQVQSKLFPKLDVFATFKISKVHLSLVVDNLLSTYLKTGTNYIYRYPISPSAFYLRMNWLFLE